MFGAADLLKLLKGFEAMVQRLDDPAKFRADLHSAIVKMTVNLGGSAEDSFLELMQYYEKQDMLHTSEELMMKLREHVEERFEFMRRDTLLTFCNFLKDLGMFFED